MEQEQLQTCRIFLGIGRLHPKASLQKGFGDATAEMGCCHCH